MTKEITVKFTEKLTSKNLVEIETKSNGKKKTKQADIGEFVKRLLTVYKFIKKEPYQMADLIEEEVIGLAYYGDSQWTVLRYHEPATWALTHLGQPITVKLPALVYELTNEGDVKIYTTKHTLREIKELGEEAEVQIFDFPNMIGGGAVCLGTFKKEKIKFNEAKDYFNKVMAVPLTHEMPKSILIEETGTYLYTILEGKNRTKKLKNIVNKQKSTS